MSIILGVIALGVATVIIVGCFAYLVILAKGFSK